MSDARHEVLARIRAALGSDADAVDVARRYRRHGDLTGHAMVERFVTRVADHDATVFRAGPDDVVHAVAEGLAGAGRLVVPAGLDRRWLPQGTAVVADHGRLTPAELDGFDAVVTAATVGIAETGTIVLDGSPDQGRRAISLVPDRHVCVVRTSQIVATVPEGVAAVDPVRPQTWVSGPSATSDIELDRVEGVHGPRTLVVVVLAGW